SGLWYGQSQRRVRPGLLIGDLSIEDASDADWLDRSNDSSSTVAAHSLTESDSGEVIRTDAAPEPTKIAAQRAIATLAMLQRWGVEPIAVGAFGSGQMTALHWAGLLSEQEWRGWHERWSKGTSDSRERVSIERELRDR